MRFSCSIITLCRRYTIPCCLENSATSMIWNAPPLATLVRHGHMSITDYCPYGCPWRKRTKVCTWSLDPASLPHLRCHGRGGVCSRTGAKHIVLTGVHPTQRVPWTKFAQPYPPSWVKAWWSCIDMFFFDINICKSPLT